MLWVCLLGLITFDCFGYFDISWFVCYWFLLYLLCWLRFDFGLAFCCCVSVIIWFVIIVYSFEFDFVLILCFAWVCVMVALVICLVWIYWLFNVWFILWCCGLLWLIVILCFLLKFCCFAWLLDFFNCVWWYRVYCFDFICLRS